MKNKLKLEIYSIKILIKKIKCNILSFLCLYLHRDIVTIFYI